MVRPRRRPPAPIAALMAVLLAAIAGAAAAFPSSTPDAAWPTAKVDAQLKPNFRALIEHRHWGYERPRWSRWRSFYWRGYGRDGEPPCDPRDPYCAPGDDRAGYACGPYDADCQGGGPGGYFCDPMTGVCQGGRGDIDQPAWVGGDPYDLPRATLYGGGRDHVSVDCREDRPGRLNEALFEVADGGVIHLKGKGPACTGALQVGKPVVIQGDAPSAFPIDADAGPAVITASPGAPCAVIDAGPRGGVEFRDVVIEAPQGGRSACLQTFSSAVALVRVSVRYGGESSALYIQGGRLVLNDTEIASAGFDAAIWAEDATLGLRNVSVSTASTGLDVRPGIGQTVALNQVSITASPGGFAGGGPMSGVIGRRGRSGDCAFVIENSYVAGFRTGLLFEAGLKVDLKHTRIDQSRMGVAIDGASLHMRDTAVDATEYGVYAYAGSADIVGGYVTSVLREPFGADPGAQLQVRDVAVYAEGCGGWRRHEGLFCHARREAPEWLFRHDAGGFRHWGWSGS